MMTEHERVRAEYKSWRKNVMFADAADGFEAGWTAAKEDLYRTQLAALDQKPQLPTFDEWFLARNGTPLAHVPGTSVASYMLDLSANLRDYVSDMVRRR